jgi:uncharacterized protein (DUF433 family)
MSINMSTQWLYLEARPKSFYRQLFVKGSRIMARTLYGLFKSAEEPLSVEQIAAEYNLPLPAVQEAIAYCASYPPEIADDQKREDALAQAMGVNDPDYKFHPTPKTLSAQELARIKNL